MDDGLELRADVFRPEQSGKFPIVLNMGPYCKGHRYQDAMPGRWKLMIKEHPDILDGSTCSYMTWETVDPEKWVPDGYICVRVDSRGAGRSPGFFDPWSPRENADLYSCIEWAGTREWSSGKVGLCGISYYAMNQWTVASMQPPHLRAIIPWEGAADHYRDVSHHGGIFADAFLDNWLHELGWPHQYGRGKNGPMDPWLGKPATGDETLSEDVLRANRSNYIDDLRRHNLDDEYMKSRSADFSKITVPMLSVANWSGYGLHERGNFEGFTQSGSAEKWLVVHGGNHSDSFYTGEGVMLQKRFFDHFLKGTENGMQGDSRVSLEVRYPDYSEIRKEGEWPLKRTRWTKVYLSLGDNRLSWNPVAREEQARFDANGDGITFLSPVLETKTEITGPLAARVNLSSSTNDADLFLTVRAFHPDGKELVFQGSLEPKAPVAQGWLRASHRKTDPSKSTPYRPYHTHDEEQKLEPGKIYELNIEIWPTCVVLPKDYQIALTIQGKDFERAESGGMLGRVPMKGSGPFLHHDARDRSIEAFKGYTTLHSGPVQQSYLVLPIIP